MAELTVADTGPGIPIDERDKVAQRFYCLEHSRSSPGSGLCLSLVTAVAQPYHAEFLLSSKAPGLKASLRFEIR